MIELSDVIQQLQIHAGFLLVAHGQSGDLGNATQDNANYNMAHENIKNLLLGADINSYIRNKVPYEPSRHSQEVSPILYGNLKKSELAIASVTRPIRKRVARSGMFGPLLDYVLGYQVRVELRPEFQRVVQYNKTATLNTYLQAATKEAAYFMAHYVRLETPLQDSSNQRDCPAPILYVLGDEATIKKTVDYLKKNPAQYGVFMKALIPTDKFPVTNRLILDQLQTPEHTFLNLDKITERIRNEDLNSICERLGEKAPR